MMLQEKGPPHDFPLLLWIYEEYGKNIVKQTLRLLYSAFILKCYYILIHQFQKKRQIKTSRLCDKRVIFWK